MSSQTLAPRAPAVLRRTPSPILQDELPDLPDVEPSAWRDHSQTEPSDHKSTSVALTRNISAQDSQQQQHRQALDSLLAALAPNNHSAHANDATRPIPPAFSNDTQAVNLQDEVNNSTEPFPSLPDSSNILTSSLNSSEFPLLPVDGSGNPMSPSLPPLPPLPPIDTAISSTPLDSSSQAQPLYTDRRAVEAFAKIEFEDGNYYITTSACELGRDAMAYKTAMERAKEAKANPNGRSQSSSGRISRPSDRVRRAGDNQLQGSVVSEAGGFGGVDNGPVLPSDERPGGSGHHPSNSSQISASDVVKPQEVLYHLPLAQFDYHRNAEYQASLRIEPDYEEPAPVTADHLPNTDTCPLIPIHAMANSTKSELATHKGISRRHVRIEWDTEADCFKMKVLGRNGVFLDDAYIQRGATKRLFSGVKIQISDIQMIFRLPNPRTESVSDNSEPADPTQSPIEGRSASLGSNSGDDGPPRLGARYSHGGKSGSARQFADPSGVDFLAFPPRKRGPGRPPKDGIMSTRERKEREKLAKLKEAKAANGGKTPPPFARLKLTTKAAVPEETPVVEARPEKRKYTKRKREGENGDVLPSIEGGEENVGSENERPVIKKPRASKSPSPEYPPLAALTEEQLTRPSEPYARLIYDILAEIHPKALPLKQIYRALKMKFPFFVYRVESDGWQSSVRHNLNQEWNKLFEKGEKEGKGFAWKAIPGALQPQAERKRAAQAAAAAKPKPQAQRNQHTAQQQQHHHPVPPIGWPAGVPFPPPHWQQGPPGTYPPPPNGLPWPPPGVMVQPPPGQPRPSHPQVLNGMPQQSGQRPLHQPGPSMPSQPQNRPPIPSGPPNQPSHSHPQAIAGPSNAKPQPQPPASSFAAPNMPCTLEGVMAIRRFENAMYDQVSRGGNPHIEHWQQIFASVKNRLLHGASGSSLIGGETKEELTIMGHVNTFIEKFRNPAFVGFGSPAPNAAVGVGSGPSSGGTGGAVHNAVVASNANANEAAVAKPTTETADNQGKGKETDSGGDGTATADVKPDMNAGSNASPTINGNSTSTAAPRPSAPVVKERSSTVEDSTDIPKSADLK